MEAKHDRRSGFRETFEVILYGVVQTRVSLAKQTLSKTWGELVDNDFEEENDSRLILAYMHISSPVPCNLGCNEKRRLSHMV